MVSTVYHVFGKMFFSRNVQTYTILRVLEKVLTLSKSDYFFLTLFNIECHWDLSLELIRDPNDRAIHDVGMLHHGFLQTRRRQAMSGHIGDVILSGKDFDVAVDVLHASVHGVVVALWK